MTGKTIKQATMLPQIILPSSLLTSSGTSIPSISSKVIHLSTYFRKIYQFNPISTKFTFFGLIYVFLLPPYFDHDAFMHHALHVLDAPALVNMADTRKLLFSLLHNSKNILCQLLPPLCPLSIR